MISIRRRFLDHLHAKRFTIRILEQTVVLWLLLFSSCTNVCVIGYINFSMWTACIECFMFSTRFWWLLIEKWVRLEYFPSFFFLFLCHPHPELFHAFDIYSFFIFIFFLSFHVWSGGWVSTHDMFYNIWEKD